MSDCYLDGSWNNVVVDLSDEQVFNINIVQINCLMIDLTCSKDHLGLLERSLVFEHDAKFHLQMNNSCSEIGINLEFKEDVIIET